jgi:hypothetical protein
MSAFPKPPAKIRNVPRWEEDCRQILALAQDLVEGRITAIEAADALHVLAVRTFSGDNEDLVVFNTLWGELVGLPVGKERRFWSEQPLAREDSKIRALEQSWHPRALKAAVNLVASYKWALDARIRRREQGSTI